MKLKEEKERRRRGVEGVEEGRKDWKVCVNSISNEIPGAFLLSVNLYSFGTSKAEILHLLYCSVLNSAVYKHSHCSDSDCFSWDKLALLFGI